MRPAYWKLTQALEELFRGDSESLGYDVRRHLENTAEDVPDAAEGLVTVCLQELFTKRDQCRAAYWGSPDARNPDVITPNSLKKVYYAEADIIEFCLIFLGTEAGYAETVARRYFVTQHISNPAWVSNSAEWLAKRSSFDDSSQAGAPGDSPELNAGQEVSASTAVPTRQAPAQPAEQTSQPVDRASREDSQNEGEESGTQLLDDDQRGSVRIAMMELAEKKYAEFDEGTQQQFVETAHRFVTTDEEAAEALMEVISIEFRVAVGDVSFEQVDQYFRANPAALEMSLIMQIWAELRVANLRDVGATEILQCLRGHPEMLDSIVHKIYVQSMLPTLLPRFRPWQLERHLADGKIEVSKNWWFRSDGKCGREGGAWEDWFTSEWRTADYGKLSVKTESEFIFIFSDIQRDYLAGTVQEEGSSVSVKTVWRAD